MNERLYLRVVIAKHAAEDFDGKKTGLRRPLGGQAAAEAQEVAVAWAGCDAADDHGNVAVLLLQVDEERVDHLEAGQVAVLPDIHVLSVHSHCRLEKLEQTKD